MCCVNYGKSHEFSQNWKSEKPIRLNRKKHIEKLSIKIEVEFLTQFLTKEAVSQQKKKVSRGYNILQNLWPEIRKFKSKIESKKRGT
jgi:hypothetical protein